MSNERDSHFREIITKAVCGKGRKFTQSKHTVTPSHNPTSILGCWIINHKYDAKKKGDCVEVEGTYDINIWYSYSGNTKTEVVTETVSYKDIVPLSSKDENCIVDDLEVIVRVLQQPNCLEATISSNGHKVIVQVEREFQAEVVGETKVCVRVYPYACEDDDDKIHDDEISDEELANIETEFLEDDSDDE